MGEFKLDDRVIITFNNTSPIDLTEFGKSLIGKYGTIVNKKRDISSIYWQVLIDDISEKHYFIEEDLSNVKNLCKVKCKL